MKTKRTLFSLCFALSALFTYAQTSNEPKVVITKKVRETDGSYTSETIVKKGEAARTFNIDEYVKANKADNTDLDIRSEGGDEERRITIRGSQGPRNSDPGDIEVEVEEITREVNDGVRRGIHWVNKSLGNGNSYSYSNSMNNNNCGNQTFLGVEEDSDEDEDTEGLVVEVVRNSAADKAGLRDNDIIMSLNDTKINRWSDLSGFVQNAKSGDKVKINYRRNGKDMTTEATLTNRNDVKSVNCQEQAPKGYLGVSEMDNENDENGAKIAVVKKSGAEKAGLKSGDVIIKLDDTEIRDFEDIQDFMEYIKPGDKVKIKYRRDGKEDTIEATVSEKKAWDWGQTDPQDNKIEIRTKNACLGICQESAPTGNRRGANIINMSCNSAARAAGLQEGDIIVEINGNRVQDFDDLWGELAQCRPNTPVDIAYVRDGKDLMAQATLNACDNNYERVTMTNETEGITRERQFYAWNMDKDDETELREKQVITIRQASDNDAPVLLPYTDITESGPGEFNTPDLLSALKTYNTPEPHHLTLAFSADPVATKVYFYDQSGRQIFLEELNAFDGSYQQEFDLSEHEGETILLRIQQGQKVYNEHLLVK